MCAPQSSKIWVLGLFEPRLEVGPSFMIEHNSKIFFELGFASQKLLGLSFFFVGSLFEGP